MLMDSGYKLLPAASLHKSPPPGIRINRQQFYPQEGFGGTASHQAEFFCHPAMVELLPRSGPGSNRTDGDNPAPLDSITGKFASKPATVQHYLYSEFFWPAQRALCVALNACCENS